LAINENGLFPQKDIFIVMCHYSNGYSTMMGGFVQCWPARMNALQNISMFLNLMPHII
jgi:hypothetical protein